MWSFLCLRGCLRFGVFLGFFKGFLRVQMLAFETYSRGGGNNIPTHSRLRGGCHSLLQQLPFPTATEIHVLERPQIRFRNAVVCSQTEAFPVSGIRGFGVSGFPVFFDSRFCFVRGGGPGGCECAGGARFPPLRPHAHPGVHRDMLPHGLTHRQRHKP